MASSAQTRTIRQGWPLLPGVLVLAGQRVRKTWGLLLAIELGMLGAVLLACVVPLYANIAMTAALRGTLNSSTQASDIVVRTQPQLISTQVISQTTNALNNELGRTLGNYLAPVQFSIESQLLPISGARMGLISAEMSSAATHLSLVAGRLPRPSNSTLEIAITPQTAQVLHIGIGSVLQTTVNFTDVYNKLYPQFLALHVVGLFTPGGGGDPFWHGDPFAP